MFAELSATDIGIGIAAACLVGLGKGGLPGAGNLSIILMAIVFSGKQSVGVLLPILICADVVAVSVYHKHTQWNHLWRLLPWTLVGVGIGAVLFRIMDDAIMIRTIGGILLFMICLQPLRKQIQEKIKLDSTSETQPKHSIGAHAFIGSTGILGGVATTLANAAGPVVGIYLLISGLPKFAFIGTSAWFFFIINLCKVPVQLSLNNINWSSLQISLFFGVFAILSALIAPKIVHYIPQKIFNKLIWAFIIIAGLKMLFS